MPTRRRVPKLVMANNFWLRTLIPSWRFFADSSLQPILEVRSGRNPENLGEWVSTRQTLRQKWYGLFFNPQVNLAHLNFTLLFQLLKDVSELNRPEDLAQRNSFILVSRLAKEWAKNKMGQEPAQCFQFQVKVNDLNTGETSLVVLSTVQALAS